MQSSMYDEKLAEFKGQEKPEVVLLVADDAALMKLAVAWPNLTISRKKKLSGSPESEAESAWWNWLWANTEFSEDEWTEKAGSTALGFSDVDAAIKTLVGNRIVYPDGTLNSFVQRYLRDRVLKLFEAKPKRVVRRSQADAE